ncbi:major facilitator superfamily (MFS) transporter [Candidatus Koribacter versatilis Ellin345]|uniref:Major facilitator superfamily (MFS) transporter n=1 Tax=Koribacter versatilis (strain Ellin345) TaxID=204669 RepID=Q1IJM7_KORVE|nr:OFA family MFS transporter [Candidatus Koribacter versatilis]ABF42923.1 major facilitator superfamily (MFS) transporter [Candidatus Koribacter versatilis Ellin345]
MPDKSLPNRWLIAVAAVIMQICLGAVYGWSVFVKPLVGGEHWTLTEVSLNFTIALAFLGVGTVIGGLWLDRVGPRMVATVAGVLYGIGYIVASIGVKNHSLTVLYIGYGVLSGVGMGMGYICPVATIAKWFPDLRGLMTGVAVAGYGAGALIMSPIAAKLIVSRGIPYTFLGMGIVYGVLVILTAQAYENPPEGWRPVGWQPTSAVSKSATTETFTVAEAMRTWQFWLLFAMLFLNTSAGIMIISQASPMAQQIVGLTAISAAGIVGLISIFNAAGRVFWAWMSDLIGRGTVYFLLFAIQAVIFFALPHLTTRALFATAVAIVGLCYGGGFGTMPSFTADFFGAKFMGGIYGWILLAWGAAAIPSPLMIAHIRQTTGQYRQAIYVIGIVMVVSLVLPILARKRPRKGAVVPINQSRAA